LIRRFWRKPSRQSQIKVKEQIKRTDIEADRYSPGGFVPLKKHGLVIFLIVVLMGGAIWVNQQYMLDTVQPHETDAKVVASASSSVAPTASPQLTPAATPESTTLQPTPTAMLEATATPKPTQSPQQTVTATHGPTATLKPTPTATPGPTMTPASKPTATLKPTPTVTPGPTVTPTSKPTATLKPTPTATPGPTLTPTSKPTATLKPTPTAVPGDLTEAQWIAEVFRLTNLERQKNDPPLPPLQQPSAALLQAAAIRAKECATLFDHIRPDGTKWYTVLDGISYRTAGENIACGTSGYLTPQMVVEGWMKSDGHRANILKADFTNLGVGYYRSAEKNSDFLAQLFIG
jgi:uncharacterized protein YkwD